MRSHAMEEFVAEATAFGARVRLRTLSLFRKNSLFVLTRTGWRIYMRRLRTYRKWLLVAFVVNLLVIAGVGYYYFEKTIPDEIRILVGEEEDFSFFLPLEADFLEENTGVLYVNQEPLTADEISLDFSNPFTLRGEKIASYAAELKLFGFLKLKQVAIDVVDKESVIPGGNAIGIYVKTDGVLVLGTGEIIGKDGIVHEPSKNCLKSGDYLFSVNGTALEDKTDLIEYMKNVQGEALIFGVRRNEEELNVKIVPVEAADGGYKIGAWVRDDTQGIGTLTFVTQQGEFGALGHGITDVDTGLLMDVADGDIYFAEIIRIVKGKAGSPGELTGIITQTENKRIGNVQINTGQGIFGTVKMENGSPCVSGKCMEIGLKQEVKTGPATILCEVNGCVESYEIEICRVDYSNSNHAKGLVIQITDKKLIELTGGIVQGMSGSPIIQNGKLIGAVTHVFIKDSTKGYGTFIENMLEHK